MRNICELLIKAHLYLRLATLKATTNKRCGWLSYINESSDSRQCFLHILALDVFDREAKGYNTHFTSGTVLLKRQQSEESYFALHILAPRRGNGAFLLG